MLGRLRMSLLETERAYLLLSTRIFNPKRHQLNTAGKIYDFLKADGKFDTEALEEAIKEVVQDKAHTPLDTLLQDPKPDCKVFVVATRVLVSEPVVFRSFTNNLPETLFDECKIWEAARATSAAPTFFDPIEIGPYRQRFIDGGLLYNNPINILYTEAADLWPERMSDAVFLSLGTGSAPGSAFEGNLKNIVEAMKKIVLQTEKSYEDFCGSHPDIVRANRIFRFQVFHGLADVGLEEYREIGRIADCTQTYLNLTESRRKVSDYLAKLLLKK